MRTTTKTKATTRTKPARSATTPHASADAAKAEAVRILTEAVGRAIEILVAAGRPSGELPNPLAATRTDADGLLDARQLSEVLGLPNYRAVFKLAQERRIPVIRLGGSPHRFSLSRLRFSLPAVRAALEKVTVPEASAGTLRSPRDPYDFRKGAKLLELRVPNLKRSE